MPVVKTVTWRCSRCRVEKTFVDNVDAQPKDWSRVLLVNPPLAGVGEGAEFGHLCNECAGLLAAWLQCSEKGDLERARREADVLREVHQLGRGNRPFGEVIRRAHEAFEHVLYEHMIALSTEDANALNELWKLAARP